MKKLLFFVILLSVLPDFASAQRGRKQSEVKWLSIALKAGFGNSLFINSDFAADPQVILDPMSPSYFYGGRFGFTYGESVGLSVEYLNGEFGQKYEIQKGDMETGYIKDLRIKTTDVLPLFRYTSEFGMYVEAGLKFTTVKSAVMSNSIANNAFIDSDLSQTFYEKYNSFVFGFGTSLLRTDRLTLTLGLRAAYGYANFVQDPNYFVTNDGVYDIQTGNVRTPESDTNPLTLQAVIDFNYFFAFWGDASCGRGRFMMFQ